LEGIGVAKIGGDGGPCIPSGVALVEFDLGSGYIDDFIIVVDVLINIAETHAFDDLGPIFDGFEPVGF